MRRIKEGLLYGYESFPIPMRNLSSEVFLEHGRQIGERLGSNFISIMEQVHSDHVEEAKRNTSHASTDALYTFDRDLLLMGTFADCVPLYFYSLSTGFHALAHAGWKGTKRKIGQKVIVLAKELGVTDLKAIIGPCIHVESYEVGEAFKENFTGTKEDVYTTRFGSVHLDLVRENFYQLEEFLPKESIFIDSENTFTSTYHSHRRDKECDRNVAYIKTL
ncbi:polyphenol oxidase family protein [Guggenheimella bovis]